MWGSLSPRGGMPVRGLAAGAARPGRGCGRAGAVWPAVRSPPAIPPGLLRWLVIAAGAQCHLASLIWDGSGVLDLREVRIVVTFRRTARKSDHGLPRLAWYGVIRGSRWRAGARVPEFPGRARRDPVRFARYQGEPAPSTRPGSLAARRPCARTAAARQRRWTRRRAAAAAGYRRGRRQHGRRHQRVSEAAWARCRPGLS
jgi:hypothetical protein